MFHSHQDHRCLPEYLGRRIVGSRSLKMNRRSGSGDFQKCGRIDQPFGLCPKRVESAVLFEQFERGGYPSDSRSGFPGLSNRLRSPFRKSVQWSWIISACVQIWRRHFWPTETNNAPANSLRSRSMPRGVTKIVNPLFQRAEISLFRVPPGITNFIILARDSLFNA
jgi:hypothetical protein